MKETNNTPLKIISIWHCYYNGTILLIEQRLAIFCAKGQLVDFLGTMYAIWSMWQLSVESCLSKYYQHNLLIRQSWVYCLPQWENTTSAKLGSISDGLNLLINGKPWEDRSFTVRPWLQQNWARIKVAD